MRSITIATVQEEFTNFGKGGKFVEVGVISLGTTTSDGSKREVNNRLIPSKVIGIRLISINQSTVQY